EVQMVQCRILEGAVMGIVVANAEDSDVLGFVIRIVVIDVVKVRTYASGFAHATHASICRQQRGLKRIRDMLSWHGFHPRGIDVPRPNAYGSAAGAELPLTWDWTTEPKTTTIPRPPATPC
nr:hypothetical protein [Candidatus Tectomicrobia bacterium]